MWELKPMLGKSAAAVLFRVKSNLKATRVKQLTDGSWLVDVEVTDPDTRHKSGTLQLREIRAEIHYEDSTTPPCRYGSGPA